MNIGVLSEQSISVDQDILREQKQDAIEYIVPEREISPTSIKIMKVFLFEDLINPTRTPVEEKELTAEQKFLLAQANAKLKFIAENDDPVLIEEGIHMPNSKSINITHQIINELAKSNIFPPKISTSIDEGISLKFSNKKLNMFLEIYNDGDIGYIIEDWFQKKILMNEDLELVNDSINRIKEFVTQ